MHPSNSENQSFDAYPSDSDDWCCVCVLLPFELLFNNRKWNTNDSTWQWLSCSMISAIITTDLASIPSFFCNIQWIPRQNWFGINGYYIMPYYITLYHITAFHTTSQHISNHIISHIKSYHIISRTISSLCIISFIIISSYYTTIYHPIISWLVVWNIFPYIGNFIISTDEIILFRGVGQPPTRKKHVSKMINRLTYEMFDWWTINSININQHGNFMMII